MNGIKPYIIFLLIAFMTGCATNSEKRSCNTNFKPLPEYVAISPISLPPLAAKTKSGLVNISMNTENTVELPYDMDLLVLPTAMSKVQYGYIDDNNSVSGGGIFGGSNKVKRHKAVYDLINMASYPMQMELPPLDKDDNTKSIVVTPYIGVGVRVVAEYNSTDIKGNLTLPTLAAELNRKDGSGSIEVQQIGISRYGTNNQGLTGISLTPDNLSQAQKDISYMMGQIWLKDTRVQPMIVGYSIPGYSSIDHRYHPYIVNKIIKNKKIIMQPFIESMFYEAKSALKLTNNLKKKDKKDKVNYNELLAKLEADIEISRKIADIKYALLLEHPDISDNVPESMITSSLNAKSTSSALKSIVESYNKLNK